MKKILRYGLFLVGALFFLSFCLFFIIKFFFPAEELKRLIENRLEDILEQQVNIDLVKFKPLSGIELENIQIGKKEHPLLFIKKLSFLYDFRQLINKKIIINQISFHEPIINLKYENNRWNIPFVSSDKKLKDDTKHKVSNIKQPFALPVLPFTIDVNEFNIKDLSFSVNYNNIVLKSSGINFSFKGKLSPESFNIVANIVSSPESIFSFRQTFPQNINVNSNFNLRLNLTTKKLSNVSLNGEIKFKNPSVSYLKPAKLDYYSLGLDLILNMVEETLQVNSINLSSNDLLNLNINGSIKQLLKKPKIDFALTSATINLNNLNRHVSFFIPQLKMEGQAGIHNVKLEGNLQNDNSFDGEVHGTIDFDNINVDYSKTNLSLKNAGGSIKLARLKIKNNFPEKVDAEINLYFDNFTSKEVSLGGLKNNIRFSSSEETPDEQIINFDTVFDEIKLNIVGYPSIIFPFQASGSSIINISKMNVKSLITKWNLPGAASGKITAAYLKTNNNKFSISNDIDLDLEKIRSYIPVSYLNDVKKFNLSGKISSRVNIKGNLNEQYHPENISFQANNKLKNVTADYPPYQVEFSGLNAESFLNAKYNKLKGIELSELKLNGNLFKIKYSNQANINKSTFSIATKSNGFFNINSPYGLKINVSGKVKSNMVELLPDQAKLNQLAMNLSFSAMTHSERTLENIKLSGDVSAINLHVANKLFSEKFKITYAGNSPYLDFNKPRINLNISTYGTKLLDNNRESPKNNITANMSIYPDLSNKSVVIKKLDIADPPFFHISLKEGMIGVDRNFNINDLSISLDMKSLLQHIPHSYRGEIPIQRMSGRVQLNTNARGLIPSEINTNNLSIPLHFQSNLIADNISLEIKKQNFKLSNLNSKTEINFDSNEIHLRGETSIDSLVNDFQKIIPELSRIDFKYDYSLKDFNDLIISKSILKIENGALLISLDGVVEGLKFLLSKTPHFDPVKPLNNLTIKLNSKLSVNEGKKLNINSPINFTGGLNTNFFIKLIPKETLSFNGNIIFNKFLLKGDNNLFIENINGNIPINKSYLLINNEETIKSLQPLKPSSQFIPQSGLFSNLRNYSKHKNLFSIDSIKAGKQVINNILIDLYLKENLFAIEQFYFELDEGSVLGNLYLFPSETGHKVSLKTNFANIDFKRILNVNSNGKEKIDSSINGNIEFIINISHDTEENDFRLDKIEMALNITHIGDKALDQILIYLDPEESNPSIANLKDKLKFAKPSRINIELKNERLSMFVQLKTPLTKSGYLNLQVLNRIPVQKLKKFSMVSDNLKNLFPFLKILTVWSSNYIVLNKKQIIFR